ncbi:hypothetical protein RTP6_005879 [Batrachochytrium dendrobatidis]
MFIGNFCYRRFGTRSISHTIETMDGLNYNNTLTSRLRVDPHTPGTPFQSPSVPTQLSHVPRQVPGAHFSYVMPTPPQSTVQLISFNHQASVSTLGIDLYPNPAVSPNQRLVDILSGASIPNGTHPWSLSYGGHQFGSWAGQLGDGRAISLGQVQHPITRAFTEIQLKGAGMTPYSRFADGYAVLRSSIREYLCAEAMHALGVPTSRSLSIVAIPSRKVTRENGDEMGAVVCRLAPSWIRFGSFELLYSRSEFDLMKELADYVIDTHCTDLNTVVQDEITVESLQTNKYIQWFKQVVKNTAEMIAHWQSVGFCHGVMNTDNFSILGITIDYGPFQFMDVYDPTYVCNHSDETGRYAFCEQPRIALWNLARLASVLDPLILPPTCNDHINNSETESRAKQSVTTVLIDAVREFIPCFDTTFSLLMSRKFGLLTTANHDLDTLYQPILRLMHDSKVDYTHFFRIVSEMDLFDRTNETMDKVLDRLYNISTLSKSEWHANPTSTQSNDMSKSIVQRFNDWVQVYRTRMLCDYSSEDALFADTEQRRLRMLMANPKYTLRNHLVAKVIQEMEHDVTSDAVDRYLNVLMRPFDQGSDKEQAEFGGTVPDNMRGLKCSCSS